MQTLGEKRVRVTFNPDKGEVINDIKQEIAKLIDLLENQRLAEPKDAVPNTERQRLISIAQTELESAAMWAVKAVTTEFLIK